MRLESVSFSHIESGEPVLSEVNLDVAPGQRVVVVGACGSGKTTLRRLAAGLSPPQIGRVLYDGQPLQDIPRPILASSIGWVSQEVALFSGSIRENITLFDDTISHEAVIAAARDAQIHDVIGRLPGGYDSMLLEGGANLSGGEAQRMEIARALAGDPNFLILDEATSALDPLVEEAIEQNLRRRGCGALVIAHRLSTIRAADEIVVLDKGRIVERGTHDELIERRGRYFALVNE